MRFKGCCLDQIQTTTISTYSEILISDSQKMAVIGQMGNLWDYSGWLPKLLTDGFCHAPFWTLLEFSICVRNQRGCVYLFRPRPSQAVPHSSPILMAHRDTHKGTRHFHSFSRSSNPHVMVFSFVLEQVTVCPAHSLYSALYCGCFCL